MYGCKFVMSGGNSMYSAQTRVEAVLTVPLNCRTETLLTSVGTVLQSSSLTQRGNCGNCITTMLKDAFGFL